MKYDELIQFSICALICFFFLRHSYLREKKEKYSERSDYASINSIKRFGILSTVLLISLIKIIIEIVKIASYNSK